MGAIDQLTHAERMSVLAHYVADTWRALDPEGKALVGQASQRLKSQLEDLTRQSTSQ